VVVRRVLAALVFAMVAVSFACHLPGTATSSVSAAIKKKRPLVRPKPAEVPAKQLFGAVTTPAPLAARAIGFYARGCLAGAKPLPVDGPAWQAMRLSRNRNWGHPQLVSLIEQLANDAKAHDGWPGLLVGDMSQPRGGPMLTGHASHQVGLDVDVWLTPMPEQRLDSSAREALSATSMLLPGGAAVNPAVWTDAHVRLIRRAASYSGVERVFVHPAIKKALCTAAGTDRAFLRKVRPYWGHFDHMHIRIACPKDSGLCEHQPPISETDDGCGKEVDDWLKRVTAPPKPPVPGAKPAPPRPGLTLSQLPAECRAVLGPTAATAPPKPAVQAAGAKH
jgi:penicillin-insensitive murein endopeptidase